MVASRDTLFYAGVLVRYVAQAPSARLGKISHRTDQLGWALKHDPQKRHMAPRIGLKPKWVPTQGAALCVIHPSIQSTHQPQLLDSASQNGALERSRSGEKA